MGKKGFVHDIGSSASQLRRVNVAVMPRAGVRRRTYYPASLARATHAHAFSKHPPLRLRSRRGKEMVSEKISDRNK